MPTEFLSEDILEDNFLKVFAPYYYSAYIFGSTRVNIKYKFVSKTTVPQNWYTVLCMIAVWCAQFYLWVFYYRLLVEIDFISLLTNIIGSTMQTVFYCITIFMNRCTQTESNIKIYAMLQKIDRTLQMNKYPYFTEFQFRLNIFCLLAVIMPYLIGFEVQVLVMFHMPEFAMFYCLGALTLYMDLGMTYAMLHFLNIRCRILNSCIKKIIRKYDDDIQPLKTMSVESRKDMTLSKFIISFLMPDVRKYTSTLPSDQWKICLRDILKSYQVVTELFSWPILNLTITLFIWVFIVIASVILGIRNGTYSITAAVMLGLWIFLCWVLLLSLAITNEWLLGQLKKTKLLCIRLITRHYDGPYVKIASDIIRTLHYQRPACHVYGLFELNSMLPLVVIGVIASNILVVFQILS